MAKSKRGANENTTDIKAQGFTKHLVEDTSNYAVDDNQWTQARNAINNSKTGDLGMIGNEPSNQFCIEVKDGNDKLTIIGAIHVQGDAWLLMSTNDSKHEIGIFREDSCSYQKVINQTCLNFNRAHLIIGVSKLAFDCTYNFYWSDGNNPDRTISIDVDNPQNNDYTNPNSPLPWVQNCSYVNDCYICTNTDQIDCEKLRLEPITKAPCLRVEKGASGGLVPNGSYYAVIAYTINGVRVSDYCVPSNVQPLFIHKNTASSLDIYIDTIDSGNYDEFELVLVQFFNGQTVASKVGIYSTRQDKITLDYLDKTWPAVPLNNVSLRNTIIDKSDGIYESGPYMLRVGPTEKFDFNYQPLANRIRTKWVNVEYPEDYYRKGGNNTGYLRDEVYAFFIRWVYNTGDKSASFHIPGRPHFASDIAPINPSDIPNAEPELQAGIPLVDIENWMVNNTATSFSPAGITISGPGTIVGAGYMGYWESEEIYNDIKPDVWNASAHTWSQFTIPPYPGTTTAQYDLCGSPIRHHRFPDNATDTSPQRVTNHFGPTGDTIRIMGVTFENIEPPRNNDGTLINNIVGYEILRGSRIGQESIIAKGMINNMFNYQVSSDDDTSNDNLLSGRQGLYPNYPYNDLNPDYFISKQPTTYEPGSIGTGPWYNPSAYQNFIPNDSYSKEFFTFHSPDTQFTDPYLSATELKMYGEFTGITEGAFSYPDKHPQHKFVTDSAFLVAMVVGAGIATLAVVPERTTSMRRGHGTNIGLNIVGNPYGAAPYDYGAQGLAWNAVEGGAQSAVNAAIQNLSIADAITGGGFLVNGVMSASFGITDAYSGTTPGVVASTTDYNEKPTAVSSLPPIMSAISGVITFYNYFTEGTDATLRLIKAYSKYNQFAAQYNSHCKYVVFTPPWTLPIVAPSVEVNKRTVIKQSRYLEPQIQDFGASHRINNLYRSRSVALQTLQKLRNVQTPDFSRFTIGQAPMAVGDNWKKFKTPFNGIASSHYVGMKQRIRNQYGQIESIIQMPVSTCSYDKSLTKTSVLFNGDTYVGRYTEKNTMFYFYNWLYNQPNDAEFNYRLNRMLPYSSFWMDTEEFDWSDFVNSIGTAFGDLANFNTLLVTPSDKHCFDRGVIGTVDTGYFTLKNVFMYLFNSGVRDFFVESNINVDLRDWGEPLFERHYDPYEYTDLKALFSTEIIKAGNFFKYDFSLSINKLFNNFITWGNTHTRDYNPITAEECYVYSPNRVIYSLPQSAESKKDFWRVFLPLNYKDFANRIVAIKRINLNGALMLFEDASPIQFLGSEQLTLESGTKVTIGDGGLFNQPLQYLDNSDRPYEYGSCQNRLSITATPVGIFYMSQNQGKIFAVASQGVQEISLPGALKWWLAQFLPYILTDDFPDFELLDNPVIGIGCQSIYDNQNMIMYFCKKDYQLRKDIPYTLTYIKSNLFRVDQLGSIVELGDPAFFSDASWTISYDPKVGQWISYHDWHPTYLIAGKNTFLSVMDNSVWLHNDACDSYCNYYGKDYPFEVEFQTDTVQQITTLRSIDYQLECYIYADNCYDRYHVLDYNFDEAIIYNSEQNSGLLRLNLLPKNNAPLIVQYPQVGPNSIDILYSKEENKYRFNQFWDVTANRGEYVLNTIPMFDTEPNGYIKNLNQAYLDYQKYPTERKKFRHYRNVVFLRRKVSGNVKMLFDIANVKNLNSPR